MLLLGSLLLNFGSIGSMETTPLYLARNDTAGLGLTPQELSLSMVPQALTVCVMPFVFPWMARRFGFQGAFYYGSLALIAFSAAMPVLRFLPSRSAQWIGLCAAVALRGTTGPTVYPAMAIMLNSVISKDLGFWNGLAQSVAASARAVAPTAFGELFAIGTAHGHPPFPLDVSMPFALAQLSLTASCVVVAIAMRDRKRAGGCCRCK